jgi:hypothetical protein
MNPGTPVPIANPQAPLSSIQRETLRVLLDIIVPPTADGRLPGAGEIEVTRQIASDAGHARAIRELLQMLDREALNEYGAAFAAIDQPRRVSLLERIRARDPLAFEQVALATVTAYYQQDPVLEGLGLEARAPYPQGYPVEAGDLSLLKPVIARGKIYREVE